jgi:uncharacterized membrane protein
VSQTDKYARLEAWIGKVLHIGVVASSVLLATGLALDLAHPGSGGWAMRIGIVVLIATPAARVVLSFLDFIVERDLVFAALTTCVLVELAAGVVAALVFHQKL